MQRNSVQSLIGERASAHVKKSTRTRVNLCMPCKQGFNYSTQNGSESRFRDRCFFFLSLSYGTYYGLFYSPRGRQSHCFTSSAIVRSKELRQVEVEFTSPLVGVHRVTFARVSEQNQEKRSLGGKQCKKVGKS